MKYICVFLIFIGLATTFIGGLIGLESGSMSMTFTGFVIVATGISLLFYLKYSEPR